ncbi:MAG: hypothetical protein HC939_15895 [Pleurocapsa sp. SU_5_0]|nr:hypothetical protein [Pleurocapsa sp. SU_5_0]NJR46846.1 hypothetical protein [Hyellaceae cyanobacterium CSU_1_1]
MSITFVSIILFGIEQIGSQLEQPFAHNPNALPLDLICQTILLNVQELIKQTDQDNQGFTLGENGHDSLAWQSESQRSHTDKRQKKQITLKDLIAFSEGDHLN